MQMMIAVIEICALALLVILAVSSGSYIKRL